MGIFDSLGNLWGMNGKEIYHNFRGGTGDDGLGLLAAAAKVELLVKNYDLRKESITKLTGQMENAWQGDAAGAAQRGAGPLAVEHGLARTEMATAQTTLGNQFDAFSTAKSSVTEVPQTPEKPGIWDNVTTLGGASRNYEDQMNEVNEANDHNVTVMNAYEEETGSNTSAMPTSYGRITPDYSAVGVLPPSPPPPPPGWVPPEQPGGTDSNTYTPDVSTSNPLQTHSTTPNQTQNPPGTDPTRPPTSAPTDPSDARLPPSVDPPPRTFPPGQGPGPNPNHPGPPGFMPPGPATFGPNGGGGGGGGPRGGGGGFGPGRGGGFGPGGGGAGGAGGAGGSGSGAGGRGPGGGFGPGGAAAAAEGAATRGGVGGRGGMGGMGGMGHGARGQGDDDGEHERPSFLVEPDPHDTFGTDEVTAPPVIGE